MKLKSLYTLMILLTLVFARCSDDDKPETIPTVQTADAENIDANSATLHGKVTDNGNSAITAAGFVYSSVSATPTLADDKIERAGTDDEFSVDLEGLNSTTKYYVRAYATNGKGTGYGDVVDFTTGNAAPTVISVSLTGDVEVNGELMVNYSYIDAEGDPEGETTFQWYSANDATGSGEAAINGATGETFTVTEALEGKYIRAGVTAKATGGTATGTEVKSNFVGAVGEATTVTFMYNGEEVTYGILTSATTSRKWLDRNLGALSTPNAVTDYANYGDLFQWGRAADGHQLTVRTGPTDANVSSVNNTVGPNPIASVSSDLVGHSNFILVDQGLVNSADWRVPQNSALWQGVNGINNPCPSGWRLPTQAEWTAESIATIDGGYAQLKLTYTGVKTFNTGEFFQSEANGNYWSSTVDESTPEMLQSTRIRFNTTYSVLSAVRSQGYACRCIKD